MITEAQNSWDWEAPPEIIYFNSLFKQDQPQQVAQDSAQMAFEYFHSSPTSTSPIAELFS